MHSESHSPAGPDAPTYERFGLSLAPTEDADLQEGVRLVIGAISFLTDQTARQLARLLEEGTVESPPKGERDALPSEQLTVSVSKAAEMLDVSPATVRRMTASGRLVGCETGTARTVVSVASIRRFASGVQ